MRRTFWPLVITSMPAACVHVPIWCPGRFLVITLSATREKPLVPLYAPSGHSENPGGSLRPPHPGTLQPLAWRFGGFLKACQIPGKSENCVVESILRLFLDFSCISQTWRKQSKASSESHPAELILVLPLPHLTFPYIPSSSPKDLFLF